MNAREPELPVVPADVTIRRAVAGDDRGLAELERAVWSWLSEVAPRPEPEADFLKEELTPGEVLVAECEGRVVGYVRQVAPTSLETNRHVRQIQGLGVDPAVRGRGIGQDLIDAACAEARSQGARRMTLRVLAHNAPARRLYERCGFTVEGVLPEEFLIDGRYTADVLMGRRLD